MLPVKAVERKHAPSFVQSRSGNYKAGDAAAAGGSFNLKPTPAITFATNGTGRQLPRYYQFISGRLLLVSLGYGQKLLVNGLAAGRQAKRSPGLGVLIMGGNMDQTGSFHYRFSPKPLTT